MAALLDIVKKGATNRSVTIRIIDSGDGTPETGVVFNTSGIDLWYRREGATKTSITEAALATPALDDAHADGGFLHIGDGEYRLDLPDAAFATGANHVDVGGTVTGMVVIGGRVRLVDVDLEDATRAGLTALPNAAADAAGGLPISDAGGLDIDAKLAATNEVTAARMGALTDWINGGRLDLILDAVLVDTAEIGAAGAGLTEAGGTGDHLTAVPWNAAWDAEVQSEVADALTAYDPATHTELVSEIDAVQTDIAALNDLDAAGVRSAVGLAAADLDTQLSAIVADTAEIGAAGAGLTAVPWNAAWDAEVQSEVNDGLVAIGLDHLVSVAVVGTDITDNSIVARLASKSATADWDSYDNTTDALEALRDHVGDGTNLTEAGGSGDHLTAVPWNAVWDAEVESEVIDALDTAIATPTAGSPLEVLDDLAALLPASTIAAAGDAMDATKIAGSTDAATRLAESAKAITTGAVVADGANTADTFEIDIGITDDKVNGRVLAFNAGALRDQAGVITDYNATSGFVTVETGSFTSTPGTGDTFAIN